MTELLSPALRLTGVGLIAIAVLHVPIAFVSRCSPIPFPSANSAFSAVPTSEPLQYAES